MQLLLSTVCLALTSAVIGNAYYQKKQFYPAVVYITKSNASMAVIYIQFFVIVFMFGKLLRKIFLGTLRAAEFEHLLERFWYALTETCLAFTVFRDDFNPRFVALFTVLLFLKSFHWLAEERVDFMERSPVLGWLFHIRVASLLMVLGTLDYVLLIHAYNSTLVRGPTVQLVFGFEYAILLTVVASTAIKYILHAAEMRTDTPWENKAVFLLYTELVIGLIKVVLYVLFVVIMAKIYALPMFVFRPMFFTIRNFKKALSDVIMSRRAIRNMNTLYPDATPEELRLSDNICIICREDMVNHSKKLPCGHIFHTTCLRSWFQRQQTCPTCRLNILRTRQEDVPAAAAGAAAAAAAGAPGVAPTVNATPTAAAADGSANAAGAPTAGQLPTLESLAAGLTAAPPPLPNGMPPAFTPPPNFAGMPMMPPPPFMMPPPFPFMPPYTVPPPEMPPNLTKYSDEELKAMEGNERQNIEERLKLLRNIQLMLDAAGVLMNNYQVVTSRMQATTAAATNNNNNNNINKPQSAAATAASPTAVTSPTAASPTATAATTSAPLVTTTTLAYTDGPSTSAAAAAAAAACRLASPLVTAKIPSTAAPAAATTTLIASGSGNGSATEAANAAKHNEVTIEDLGGEEDQDEQGSTAVESATDNTELCELRKRRLKFLDERNKTATSTSATPTTQTD